MAIKQVETSGTGGGLVLWETERDLGWCYGFCLDNQMRKKGQLNQ